MANEPRITQNYEVPIIGSVSTSSSNAIGTAAVQVLSGEPSRRSITFHNPNYDSSGGTDLLVAQSATPTFAAPGGGFIVFPGASLPFVGDAAQGPWYVTARAGSGKGVTVVTSMKLP